MKQFVTLALAASALIAAPACAQNTTGTITLNGNVAAKCSVSPGNGNTFAQSVDFLELAQADGTLRTGLATNFGTKSATVVCNTGTPKVSVDANPLATSGAAATGYDNSIDYTASVAVTAVGANAGPFTNASSAAAGTLTAVGSALATSASNVQITTTGYATNNATDVLVAGAYTGNIIVVIAPN